MEKNIKPSHFKGKEAVEHVIEAQTRGIISAAEIHGEEAPGHISAGADAARETAIALLLLGVILAHLSIPFSTLWLLLALFSVGWLVWKIGRSAWLGWARLERLHRIVAEERWEIEHHREQEREELAALYEAKGFHGKLLEDVMDVLMSDGDRLLRVMLEEELGLSLEKQEHPLKQGLGAGIGTLIAIVFCGFLFFLFPTWGLLISALVVMALAGAISARYEKNRVIPAMVWSAGIGALAFGCVYFLLHTFLPQG